MHINSRWNVFCRTASVFFLIFAASAQPWPGLTDHILSCGDKYRQDMDPDSCNNALLRLPRGNEQVFYYSYDVDLRPTESLIRLPQIYHSGMGFFFAASKIFSFFSELFL